VSYLEVGQGSHVCERVWDEKLCHFGLRRHAAHFLRLERQRELVDFRLEQTAFLKEGKQKVRRKVRDIFGYISG